MQTFVVWLEQGLKHVEFGQIVVVVKFVVPAADCVYHVHKVVLDLLSREICLPDVNCVQFKENALDNFEKLLSNAFLSLCSTSIIVVQIVHALALTFTQ